MSRLSQVQAARRDWFDTLADWSVLGLNVVSELQERGFTVLPDAVSSGRIERLAIAYNAAAASATGDDISIGSTSTRVTDFVNRGAEFDRLYVFPPLLNNKTVRSSCVERNPRSDIFSTGVATRKQNTMTMCVRYFARCSTN